MRIEDRIRRIIAIPKRDGVPTNVAADTLALERIAAISSMERLHTGHPYGQLSRRRRRSRISKSVGARAGAVRTDSRGAIGWRTLQPTVSPPVPEVSAPDPGPGGNPRPASASTTSWHRRAGQDHRGAGVDTALRRTRRRLRPHGDHPAAMVRGGRPVHRGSDGRPRQSGAGEVSPHQHLHLPVDLGPRRVPRAPARDGPEDGWRNS